MTMVTKNIQRLNITGWTPVLLGAAVPVVWPDDLMMDEDMDAVLMSKMLNQLVENQDHLDNRKVGKASEHQAFG